MRVGRTGPRLHPYWAGWKAKLTRDKSIDVGDILRVDHLTKVAFELSGDPVPRFAKLACVKVPESARWPAGTGRVRSFMAVAIWIAKIDTPSLVAMGRWTDIRLTASGYS